MEKQQFEKHFKKETQEEKKTKFLFFNSVI